MILHERLEAALQYLAGARVLREAGDYAGALSRCYYAAYQAMWAALGVPTTRRRWEHAGIIQAFVRGRWDDPAYPMTGPGRYERFRFPLRSLYRLRLGVDYHIESVTQETADWALGVVKDLIDAVSAKVRERA
jgi:uncharacterized protein (UPF0332 family)